MNRRAVEALSATAPLAEMRGIVKEFPGVLANDRVDFELRPGEVHALLGENGAGKTTLMNILAGLVHRNAGTVAIAGKAAELRSPRDAIDRGIGMVHQHFRLVDRFTAAENITLGWHTPKTFIRTRELEGEIARLSEEFRMRVDPGRPIWQLISGGLESLQVAASGFHAVSTSSAESLPCGSTQRGGRRVPRGRCGSNPLRLRAVTLMS